MNNVTEKAMDAHAHRAARNVGLLARKSRWRVGSIDNLGGFMIYDPSTNIPVQGDWWDLSAEAVFDYCAG